MKLRLDQPLLPNQDAEDKTISSLKLRAHPNALSNNVTCWIQPSIPDGEIC
jgi:hypothetical protein